MEKRLRIKAKIGPDSQHFPQVRLYQKSLIDHINQIWVSKDVKKEYKTSSNDTLITLKQHQSMI